MRVSLAAARAAAAIAILISLATLPARLGAQASATDALWIAYWKADSPKAAAADAEKLLKAGVTFDDAYRRLKSGRAYAPVNPGPRAMRFSGPGGAAYDNTIDIPASYDPARRWPVRVQLHGGVDRQDPDEGRRRRGQRIPGEPQIVVEPFGWADSAWWHTTQVDNILTLVDKVKRQFNVDESQVYLTGTSDGGTGTYYLAMREPTLFAAMLPLIGHLGVLANPQTGVDGQLYVSNLVNRPLFIVNGFGDPKYPAARVAPYVEAIQSSGATAIFRPQTSGGHDTSWWDQERGLYERFVHDHPRPAHPALLSWETERTDRANRIQWLIVDELGPRSTDVALVDTNTVSERFDPDFGLRGDAKKEKGTRVVQVVAGSDAESMGVKTGDKLLAIDGQPVEDIAAIQAAFDRNPGPRIAIVAERAGQRLSLEGRFPPEPRRGAPRPIFGRSKPSGRVDVVRKGNTYEARTRGVARFTLLVSPDAVDMTRPIVVTVNGRTVHDAVVAPDVRRLLTWAAKDDDRTMLYGAALTIVVP